MESEKEKRSFVRERIRRIARSTDRFDLVIVKVVVGTLLALIIFLAGYYLIG
ncbi:MAG: hypothetical protein KF687_04465 [Cyclobacteriaceae bacterium]|nr:hypothetical protein [Cyclobacteriaceae bacterium]